MPTRPSRQVRAAACPSVRVEAREAAMHRTPRNAHPGTRGEQKPGSRTIGRPAQAVIALLVALVSATAGAVPAFNRQTGQNCMACHAGGQFPELTAYGRLFKLTGYTIGERTLPFAAMAVVSDSHVTNT